MKPTDINRHANRVPFKYDANNQRFMQQVGKIVTGQTIRYADKINSVVLFFYWNRTELFSHLSNGLLVITRIKNRRASDKSIGSC